MHFQNASPPPLDYIKCDSSSKLYKSCINIHIFFVFTYYKELYCLDFLHVAEHNLDLQIGRRDC